MTVDNQTSIGPLGYWKGCYRQYATFAGRACRAEYWWYTLLNVIIYAALIAVGLLISDDSDALNALFGFLILACFLIMFLPTLAVTCRRLHDAGLSGWWQLLGIIPVGSLVVFIMTVLDSNPGPNKYGPEPH